MDLETLKSTHHAIIVLTESNNYSVNVMDKYNASKDLPHEQKIELYKQIARSALSHANYILELCPDGEVDLGEVGKYSLSISNVQVGPNNEETGHTIHIARVLPETTTPGLDEDYGTISGIEEEPFVATFPESKGRTRHLLPILDVEETLDAIHEALQGRQAQETTA